MGQINCCKLAEQISHSLEHLAVFETQTQVDGAFLKRRPDTSLDADHVDRADMANGWQPNCMLLNGEHHVRFQLVGHLLLIDCNTSIHMMHHGYIHGYNKTRLTENIQVTFTAGHMLRRHPPTPPLSFFRQLLRHTNSVTSFPAG